MQWADDEQPKGVLGQARRTLNKWTCNHLGNTAVQLQSPVRGLFRQIGSALLKSVKRQSSVSRNNWMRMACQRATSTHSWSNNLKAVDCATRSSSQPSQTYQIPTSKTVLVSLRAAIWIDVLGMMVDQVLADFWEAPQISFTPCWAVSWVRCV